MPPGFDPREPLPTTFLEKEALCPLHTLQVFIDIDETTPTPPLPSVFSRLDHPTSLSLSFLERCSSHFTILVALPQVFFEVLHSSLASLLGRTHLVR